jgi:hypothetical protein
LVLIQVVAIGVMLDLFVRLSRLAGNDAIDALAHLDDFTGLDVDVCRRATNPTHWVVQQEAGVWQAEPSLPDACQEDERLGAITQPVPLTRTGAAAFNEADHVVDGVASLEVPAWAATNCE